MSMVKLKAEDVVVRLGGTLVVDGASFDLKGGELAVLFCFVFLFFAIAGGGSWSLDRYMRKTPDTLSRVRA